MRNVFGPGTHLGYCTNVHPGESLADVRGNLRLHAVAVKSALSVTEPFGVGLWLSAAAAEELHDPRALRRFRELLHEHGLYVFTLNGFPYGDFQRPVVKHDVYHPNWTTRKRLDYTIRLIDILAELLPPEVEGGISTLPIGWRADFVSPDGTPLRDRLSWAAGNLREIADHLHDVAMYRHRRIHLDLEPEPGCCLDTSADVVAFFDAHLLNHEHPDRIRRHVRICHDVCHAAVLFEPQAACFERYSAAGISVGKVQISSALRLAPAEIDPSSRSAARAEYAAFDEPRFLHQTVLRPADGGAIVFFDDLPAALPVAATAAAGGALDEWRTHYHVPVFLDRVGLLHTTRAEISAALQAARAHSDCAHFEVETYAWGVLPPALRVEPVTDGIARELQWVRELAKRENPS